MSSMFERITGKSQTSSINKSQTSSNSMFERITGKSQATSGQEILKQKYKTYDSARRNLSSYLETQGVSVVDNEPNKLRYNPDYSLDRFSTKKSTTDLYTTVEKHKEAMNTDEAKALREIITEKGNDYALEKYRQDLAKVEQEDVNLWDKTGGNVTRAIDDLFSMFKNTVQYTDETGKKVNLPSYNDLKQQKVSENYDTQVGKFLGDALYNGTKILGSMGINAVTGGVGGSTVYFSDMYSTNQSKSLDQH